MFKKLIIVFSLLTYSLAQANTQISINLFQKQDAFVNLTSQQNGLYKNHISKSNISFEHDLKTSSSNSINLKWFLNEDEIVLQNFSFIMQKEYGTFKIGQFPKERIYELNNFSSGSMVFSDNAKYIPGVSFNTNWLSVYDFFDIKVELYQGKFNSQNNYSEGPYLHYKSVLLNKKVGQNLIGFSIQHAVQFGGVDQFGEKIPINPRTFFRMIAAQSGDDSQPTQDRNYKIGNGLGSYTFFVSNSLKNGTLDIYYEHFFDDKSGAKMKNMEDGLLGVMYKNHNFELLFENLNTRHQSGKQHPPGVDSYYWHKTYAFGWTNDEVSIGNSLIKPTSNRKLVNSLTSKVIFNSMHIIAQLSSSKEYVPFTDKNGNEPYENVLEVLEKYDNYLFGIKREIINDQSISLFFAKYNNSNNIKLSYHLSF